MRNRGAGRGWRALSRFALIGVIGGSTAACSTDTSRLTDPFTNPFSSLASEPSATGSLADETDTAPPPAIRTPRIQSGDLGAPSAVMSPRPAPRVTLSESVSSSVAGMNPDAGRMTTPRISPAAPAPKLQISAAQKLVDSRAAEAEARKHVEARRLAEADARKQAEIEARKEVEAKKIAEARKLADSRKAAEQKAAELKSAEAKKVADAAEAKKAAEAKAHEARKAADATEAKRLAEVKKAAEAKKLAEAEAKKATEVKKLAEAEAKKAQSKVATKDAPKADPAAERKAEAARKAEAEAKVAKAEAAKEAAKRVAEAKAAEAEAKAASKEAAKAAAKEAAKVASKEPVKEKIAEKEPEKPAPVKVASADPVANPATATDATESFRWPAKGRVINGYGSSGNEGINISVPEGTPVKAAEDGTVAYAGSDVKGYGKLVLVRHNNGYVSAYAHNGELDVRPGEKVKRGQTIAKSGATGNVTSPQLHFEIRKGATPVDPIPHLASN